MPIHLFWLQATAQIGGTELMNFRTWQQLDKVKFSTTICLLDRPGPISELYRQAGHNPIHLPLNNLNTLLVWRQLRRLWRRQMPDIVYIFGRRANLLARPAARLFTPARVITGQRTIYQEQARWLTWADRITRRWVDLYITNSHKVTESTIATLGLSPPRCLTIHSGLNADPYAQAAAGQIRAELGIAPDAAILTLIGNLRPPKNHEIILAALRRLHDDGRPAHLLLIGSGSRQAYLQNLTRQLKLTPWVHFLGQRRDIPAILADTDIKVLCSRREGLPGAIMEAMAAARPVVATAVGGVPELVVDGVTGLLVPPDDPVALAAALADLLSDNERRRQLGLAGQQRIRQHFDLKDQVARLEAAFAELAATGRKNHV